MNVVLDNKYFKLTYKDNLYKVKLNLYPSELFWIDYEVKVKKLVEKKFLGFKILVPEWTHKYKISYQHKRLHIIENDQVMYLEKEAKKLSENAINDYFTIQKQKLFLQERIKNIRPQKHIKF
jgi:hypothetical protein